MAKVIKHYTTQDIVEMKPVVTSKKTDIYTMELSEQEAQVIKCLTGSVAQNNKARSITDNICSALRNVGVINNNLNVKSVIYFEGDFLNA